MAVVQWGYTLSGECDGLDAEDALAKAIGALLADSKYGVTATNRGVTEDGEIVHTGPLAIGKASTKSESRS